MKQLPPLRDRTARIDRTNLAFIRAVLARRGASVFVDTSKLLTRLTYLLDLPELDLRIVWLARDARGFAASAKRRGGSADAGRRRVAQRSGGHRRVPRGATRTCHPSSCATRISAPGQRTRCGELWTFCGVRAVEPVTVISGARPPYSRQQHAHGRHDRGPSRRDLALRTGGRRRAACAGCGRRDERTARIHAVMSAPPAPCAFWPSPAIFRPTPRSGTMRTLRLVRHLDSAGLVRGRGHASHRLGSAPARCRTRRCSSKVPARRHRAACHALATVRAPRGVAEGTHQGWRGAAAGQAGAAWTSARAAERTRCRHAQGGSRGCGARSPRRSTLPDREVSWLLPAVWAAWRRARQARPDVIYSSGPAVHGPPRRLLCCRGSRAHRGSPTSATHGRARRGARTASRSSAAPGRCSSASS